MVNNSISCDEVQLEYTRGLVQGVRVGLYRAVTPRSWQNHLKVTPKSQQSQHKTVEKADFCCFDTFFSLKMPMIVKPNWAQDGCPPSIPQEITGLIEFLSGIKLL